jgi:hypothetical protein
MTRFVERVQTDGGQRGRADRFCLQDHQSAVLEMVQGKRTVDKLAKRLGVRAERVVDGRDAAPACTEAAHLSGAWRITRQRDLAKEPDTLRDAFATCMLQVELPLPPVFDKHEASPAGRPLPADDAGQPVAATSPRSSRGAAPVALLAKTRGGVRQAVDAERAKALAVAARAAPSTEDSAPRSGASPGRRAHRGVPIDEHEPAIKAAVDEFAEPGVPKLWVRLHRRQVRVSRRPVHAVVPSAGARRLRHTNELRGVAPRRDVVTPLSNRHIGADLITVSTSLDGDGTIPVAVGCGSRRLLDGTAMESQAPGPWLASNSRALVPAFGVQKQPSHGVDLKTDHGPQHTVNVGASVGLFLRHNFLSKIGGTTPRWGEG